MPPLAALLLFAGATADAEAPAQLPGGDSGAFRTRMMNWSEPAVAHESAPLAHARFEAASHAPPAALPRLTSRFGYRLDPIRGGERMHTGIDIPGPLGTPIRASAGGIVRFAGRAGGYGEMIEIDHGGGLQTRYGHLSRILVSPGMTIEQGQVLGLMGSTGRSTGSHLHFEVRSDGHAADPLAFLTGRSPMTEGPRFQTDYKQGSMVPLSPHVSDFARRRAQAEAEGKAGE